MKNSKIIITIMVVFLFSKIQYAQYGTIEDSLSIAQQLYSVFNVNYIVQELIDVNAAESIGGRFGFMTDPYNTLSECLIFIAEKEGEAFNDQGVLGIYKNNQIIWRSNIVQPNENILGSILASFDANNDGKVDIMATWRDPYSRIGVLDLWIYSWDGVSAAAINGYNEFGSGIRTCEGMGYDFADYEGDGVWEIIGYDCAGDSVDESYDYSFVYSWNGVTYDFSEIENGDPKDRFFPRNNFTAEVISTVDENINSTFNYKYLVRNNPSSSQSINKFDVFGNIYPVSEIISPLNWEVITFGEEVSWKEKNHVPYNNFSFKYKIKPGTELNNFSYKSDGLPFIADAYLRGFNYESYPDIENYTGEDDYLNNSVIISVVAATAPPSPFIPISFLDSLLTYNQRSFELEWIKNQTTADKYDSLFNLAKSQLQQNNNTGAKAILQTVLQEVDIDSTDNLTSEAYALLHYNTEYLIGKIPAQIQLDISVINPAMSLVNPGAFTMEVKGSGFSSSSVVYFNGNARATTFVSDSVLNTQILSTDVSVSGNFPVWVSDNTLNSDTLIYKVVSTLPQPVRPVLECVTNNGDGTYTAHFGYKNDNDVSVYIPIGNRNKFTPNPQDRGQTRVFKPGRQIKVYTVNFNGSNLVWTLNGRTSTASANSAPCQ